jgi:2-polyprenyl-3-methyl-5-hydroxy-6-metoxy-1,4-benzoquinol methylase
MEPAADSLERLVPERLSAEDATGGATLALHLERYEFAAKHLRPGRALDLACGVGYGTKLLAERSGGPVVGADVSPEAIAHARRRYAAPGVEFLVSDAMTFADPAGFASIVSLETVEHLPDPRGFLSHVVGLLHAGGTLVASVPTTPSSDVNPHHLHDFTERSFRALGAALGLVEVDALRQVQPVPLGAVLGRSETRMADLRPRLWAWYLRHPRAAARRLAATLRHGLANHYLTIAWRKPA